MNTDAIKVEGLCKHYKDFALRDVSFTVPAGMIVGFVGENGAGKTTTIDCILGAAFADTGSIHVFGQEVSRANAHYIGDTAFANLRQDIGVVFDSCPFPNEYTIGKIEKICAAAYNKWDSALFNQLLEAFQLTRTKTVKELSRGMGMKVSMAIAMAHRPHLLVLDEATAGLDPIARDEVLDLIKARLECEDCAVLMSSHITSDLERVADRLVCIHEGRILFDVPTEEITDKAGSAHCSSKDMSALQASGVFAPGELLAVRSDFSTAVLVDDRLAFAEAFPEIPCERLTIDEYMTFMLKGERL